MADIAQLAIEWILELLALEVTYLLASIDKVEPSCDTPYDAVPPLPDFQVIAQNHRALADEMSKCANIPAFNGSRAILDVLREMREEIREMREEIGELKTGLKASNMNNIARLANSHLNNPNYDLYPLHDIETGLPTPNFPPTPAALANLDVASLNAILRALGADISGGPEPKRQRLRTYIGLRPLPV